LYSPNTNQIGISVSGVPRLFVSSTGFGIDTTTPDSSAALEVSSTLKGFLIPRMTTSQRDSIATPANGLQIYNTTTNQVNFYNGSAWTSDVSQNSVILASSGSAGSPSFSFQSAPTTGMYNSGTNQIGFSTNGQERMTVNPSGYLGVGTTSPSAKIHAKSLFTAETTILAEGISSQTTPVLEVRDGSSIQQFAVQISGRTGFGVNSPQARAHIKTTAPAEPVLLVEGATSPSAPVFEVKTGSTQRLVVQPSGAVDIAGPVKVGTSGAAISFIGNCTTPSVAATTTGVAATCTGVPASGNVVVSCSPTATIAGSVTARLNAINAIMIHGSTTLASVTYNCMWVQF
jgi:hypothetical protein